MEHLPLGPPITIKPIVLRSIVVFLVSLILIPTLLLILRPGTVAAWFDDSYAYRQKITFTHNANLTDASMRLTISNTDTLIADGKMQADCDDSRFTDGNGKLLRFKLVSGCNSASTVYDVVFPTVLNGSNLAYFYYGNPSAASESDASVPDGTVPSGAPSFGSEEKGPSPALYLRFDEGYGTTTEDTTSNNNDGAISGAAWQTKDLCLVDNCLFFDGSDDVVTVTNADSLDMDQTLAAGMTYQAWVRVNSDGEGSAGQIFNKGTNTYLRIANDGADGSADLEASLALATSNATVTITDGIALNTWTHIAVAYTDDADDEITVYINGIQKGASVNGSGGPAADANNLLIGGPTTANFHGFIDEWKVYPVERTSEQIKTDTTKAASLHGTSVSFGGDVQSFHSEGLIGYWKLDESSGNAADSSGNAATLTNNNATPFNGGKFANAPTFNGSTMYFSAGSTIAGVKSISFWAKLAATTDNYIHLANGTYINSSTGSISAPGFTNPTIYVNGIQSTTVTANAWQLITITTDTPISANTFEIGRANGSYATNNSQLDDVRLYNRTLSVNEVQRLYDWGPGPVGHWSFDENGGATANDISGNANTGTLTNGPVWEAGKLSQALEFDGVDDYVAVNDPGTDSALDFTIGQTITLSLWIQPSALPIFSGILTKGLTDGGQANYALGQGWDVGFEKRVYLCYRKATDDNSPCFRINSDVLSLGTWTHVVSQLTYGTPESAQFYINGVAMPGSWEQGTGTEAPWVDDRQLWIGDNTFDPAFPGLIDDVRIYNYALTPKQIVSVMNADHPAVGSPVGSAIAHYKFDEGYGATANDTSPNANNLTLNTASAAWNPDGKFDKAWHGYGSNWLSRADDNDFDFTATEDFTISTWFRSGTPTNPGTVQYLLDKYGGSQGYAIYANTNGTVCIGIDDDASWNPDVSACSATDIYDQQWHHLVATRNVFQDTLSLYVNGTLAQATTDTTTATLANATTLYVGDDDADATNSFTGDLDDLKLYRYALNTDEVKLEYNQGKAIVLGSLSTNPDDTASNSAARAYCPPGDTATCNPPVAHWTLDERTGTTANDISGNNNTGTLTGGPRWEKGKLSQALEFNGSLDHVKAGAAESLNMGTGDYTVSMWIKATDPPEDYGILLLSGASSPTEDGVWFSINGSTGRLETYVSNGSSYVVNNFAGTQDLRDNAWHHIVWMWDRDVGNSYYIDGALHASNTSVDSSNILSDLAYTIGGHGGSATNFNGLIDDIRIYNYARTPAQIAWDYNRGAPIAHYEFDTCSAIPALS